MHVHSAFSVPKTFARPSLHTAEIRQGLHSKDSITLTPSSAESKTNGAEQTPSSMPGKITVPRKVDSKAASSPGSLNALFQKHSYENLVEHGGNWSHESFENFTAARKFIADTIPKSGTILDIGCANGFFLRCLQEWAPSHKLTPYGVDINANSISESRKIYPELSNNFAVQNFRDYLKEGPPKGLPKTYDYIYFSILKLNDKPEIINHLLSQVNPGGRLILGFYGSIAEEKFKDYMQKIANLKKTGSQSIDITDINQDHIKQKFKEFYKGLTDLKKAGIPVTEIIENSHGFANMVAYIQK
jgi:SAM-dependent methyltransferase